MRNNRKLLMLCITLAAFASGCGNNADSALPAAAQTTIGMEIDDTVVTTKVKAALLADADIKSFDLKVETRKGAVQLSGFVNNQAQVERAVSAARVVDGVKSVENAISMKDGPATVGNSVDDGIITTRVKSAFFAESGVKSADIGVVTRKGEVQLSGYVDSQNQIDLAIALAAKVEGVTRVDNELSIKK